MAKEIVIIDYGMGNLHSVSKGFAYVGVKTKVSSNPSEIKNATALVLPGVGAFGDAMHEIKRRKLFNTVKDFVKTGKPIIGICLGMQLLFTESEEFGRHKGFGFIEGKVKKFDGRMKVPHMGWNEIFSVKKNPILKGIKDGSHAYFVHSYYAQPKDPEAVLTVTEYSGFEFTSSVSKDNVYGFQFHPEKSGEKMLKIYKNFSLLGEKAKVKG